MGQEPALFTFSCLICFVIFRQLIELDICQMLVVYLWMRIGNQSKSVSEKTKMELTSLSVKIDSGSIQSKMPIFTNNPML